MWGHYPKFAGTECRLGGKAVRQSTISFSHVSTEISRRGATGPSPQTAITSYNRADSPAGSII